MPLKVSQSNNLSFHPYFQTLKKWEWINIETSYRGGNDEKLNKLMKWRIEKQRK